MASISLCMIVKNEEQNLAACLDSVKGLVDEIIIVDTGSTDGTVDLARRHTDNIYFFEWMDDFSAARNFSLSKATCDYLMWLDADDVIEEVNHGEFLKLKENLHMFDIVVMKYHIGHNEQGEVIKISSRERVFKGQNSFRFEGAVHERIPLTDKNTKIEISDIFVTHTKNVLDDKIRATSLARNFSILDRAVKSGSYSARDLYYYATMLAGKDEAGALPYLLEFVDNPGRMEFTGIMAYLCLHNIYLNYGEINKALKILTDYEHRNSHMSEYYCALGDFYHKRMNETQNAIAAFKKALSCDSVTPSGFKTANSPEYYYYIPRLRLGELYVSLNRFEEAVEHYRHADSYPHDNQALPQLIEALERLNQMQGAVN